MKSSGRGVASRLLFAMALPSRLGLLPAVLMGAAFDLAASAMAERF